MALSVGIQSLADVRRAVAIRCNFGNQPTRVKQVQPILDEYIQEAHTFLAGTADWLAALRHYDVSIVDAQQEYDFPDDCLPGNVDQAVVVDSQGYERELEWGMRPQERNSATISNKGQPLRIEIRDGAMFLFPPPDATSWKTLRLYYRATPSRPVDADDKIMVDFECLVKLATRKVRLHFKMPLSETKEEWDEFLATAVAQQSDLEVFGFLGQQSFKNRHKSKNRIAQSQAPLSGPAWQPPGF